MHKILFKILVIVNLLFLTISFSTVLAEDESTAAPKENNSIKTVYNSNLIGVVDQMLRSIGEDHWVAKEKKVGGQVSIGEAGFNIYLGQDAVNADEKDGLFLRNYNFTNPLGEGKIKVIKGRMVLQEVGKGLFRFSTELLPGIRVDTNTHSYTYNGTGWIETSLLPLTEQ
ncbi:MAG: hypothetical protein KKD05_03210 [Candidatus Omnitrophica bacterium]|nr:hypothetical protein [Candidatus Omnitrophota bacterium]